MDTVRDSVLRDQLLDRRRRLQASVVELKGAAYLENLLQEVDSALERIDRGSYGLCEFCHESIEAERLLSDPLVRYCLDHLTADQQRALEQDLGLAARIQSGLLPKQNLTFGGWEAYYHYEAVGPVSGDYCDLVISEDGKGGLFFLLGDVSGKGVAASMLMAHLHAIFRSLISVGLRVNQLVERANRLFCEGKMPEHFATLVCGRASNSGEVEVCNAGHCPPLVIRRGQVASMEATGLPLGVFSSGQFAVESTQLAVGDTLFLYSDGLSEARNGSNAEFGTARLSGLVGSLHALPPQALTRASLEDLSSFLSGAPRADDLTIMVIRRTDSARR